jgi:hypothetical protein
LTSHSLIMDTDFRSNPEWSAGADPTNLRSNPEWSAGADHSD